MSGQARRVRVLEAGPLTSVQDAGRPGWAHLGVTGSGFLDRASARWANRLVGNAEGAALLETTAGGVRVQVRQETLVAVTGARAQVRAGGRQIAQDEAVVLEAGVELHVGPARTGLRSYLAFGGGIDVPAVLGSRSTDVLGQVGPAVLTDGTTFDLGEQTLRLDGRHAVPTGGLLPRSVMGATPVPEVWEIRVQPGPRADWLDDVQHLHGAEFVVGAGSNRVGLRLEAPAAPLGRRPGELTSEPTVLGAVQLPASGQPVIFLADHPTTGGYPVVAVVLDADLDLCARVRPGERVRLRLVR